MQKKSLMLAVLRFTSTCITASHDCNVKFKQDVFTHSKEMQRPLRIKIVLQHSSYPCTLSVRLPNNQTARFTIEEDNIEAVDIPESFKNNKINVKRKSTEKLWLDIFSLDQESRSGVYEISGHTIYGIQTPSKKNILLSKPENLTCKNKLYENKRGQQISGSVNITRQFSLCRRYNKFVGNDRYLKYDIKHVTVKEHSIDFIATDNDRGYQVVEVSCEVKGGDGVKIYKIKFNLDVKQCPSISSSINTSQFLFLFITAFLVLSK